MPRRSPRFSRESMHLLNDTLRELVVCFSFFLFFFQAEDGIRDDLVTGVQTCALPILNLFQLCGEFSGAPVVARAEDKVEQFLECRCVARCASQDGLEQPYGFLGERSEERRVGKECRSRWSPDH